MISIDRVYKTLLFFANSDMLGNVKPDDLRVAVNTTVNDIYEDYFSQLNQALNRKNRGLDGVGLESVPDKIREKILHFLVDDETELTYSSPVFNLPTNIKYIDAILYNNDGIEPCKNNREFKQITNLADTTPSETFPIYLKIGDTIKVAPTTIVDSVTISYLRTHNIANWTFTVVGDAEIYNPSANDHQDIDLHPSEEYNVILKTLAYFGVNLKENDLVNIVGQVQQQEFNQDNAV